MRFFLFLFCFTIGTQAQAAKPVPCPELTGSYMCTVSDSTEVSLRIDQISEGTAIHPVVLYRVTGINEKNTLTFRPGYRADEVGYVGPGMYTVAYCGTQETEDRRDVPALFSHASGGARLPYSPTWRTLETFAVVDKVLHFSREHSDFKAKTASKVTAVCKSKYE